MSYRTSVNNVQIFGNNEYYSKWIDFLRSENVNIDEEGCYDDYIYNLQGMFDVIDAITRDLIYDRHCAVLRGDINWNLKPYKELTDLSDSIFLNEETPLLMFNMMMIQDAYCFLPYQVFKAVENDIEKTNDIYKDKDGKDWSFITYKLKEGRRIRVSAG